LIVFPLADTSIEECDRTTCTAKLPARCPNHCHVQKDDATKTSPPIKLRREKSCTSLVSRYATTTRAMNVVKLSARAQSFATALLA